MFYMLHSEQAYISLVSPIEFSGPYSQVSEQNIVALGTEVMSEL